MEEKEEKREEDKIEKETRAFQVPCGSETYGYSAEKTTDRMPPRKLQQMWINEKDIEEKEG